MISLIKGDMLKAGAEALVNTVNTVGVMGKGITLQFKEAFPYNNKVYREACKKNINLPQEIETPKPQKPLTEIDQIFYIRSAKPLT